MADSVRNELRLVSWNMGYWQHRGEHEDAWRYLFELQPDIALLQEARPPDWVGPPWHLLQSQDERWWSLVLTRELPGHYEAPEEVSALSRFGTYIAMAQLDLAAGPVFVASVHARAQPVDRSWLGDLDPDTIRRSVVPEVWQNDLAYYLLRKRAGHRPVILGGDWNTCRSYDPPHPEYRGGRAFFSRVVSDGLVEACHEGDGPEAPTRPPYALDHVFVSPQFKPRGVTIETAGLAFSDHAPVKVELGVANSWTSVG